MTTRRLAAALLTMALFGALLAPAALAATDDTTVTVNAGTLGMDAITVANFAAVDIGSSTQTTLAAMDNFNVRDFRGTGDGWNVTAVATQFQEVDAQGALVTDGETLAFDSLAMPQPTVAAVGDTDPTSVPTTVDPGSIDSTTGTASQIATASAGTGMGEYEFTVGNLSLTIPTDVVATSYRSTVTVDLVSGP